MREIEYRDALNEAFDEELARDENVVLMGEEVAQYNGAYKVTRGLWDKWGDKRVVDTPISEAGFIGMGIGASMLGIRPVMELMFWSFHSVAFDQLVNNAACCRYMSGGLINVPIVMRGPANGGTNVGGDPLTHSRGPFRRFPRPQGLLARHSSRCQRNDENRKSVITILFMSWKNTTLYGNTGEVPDPAAGDFLIPLGKADIKREGSDISLIAHGASVLRCLEAADILANEHNIDAEVVDLRSIRPLDQDAIIESVKKTNRAVLVDESKPFCGVSAQITTLIQEYAFDYLDAPVKRVCTIDAPAIYSPHVEPDQLPNAKRIVAQVLTIA